MGWCAFLAVPLAVLAAVQQGLFAQAQASFMAELAGLAVVTLALAGLASAGPRLRALVPNMFIAVFLAGIATYCGFGSLAACLVLCLAAVAMASLVLAGTSRSISVMLLAGFALLSSLVGWLLPFPLHGTRSYLLIAIALVSWRWMAIRPLLEEGLQQWKVLYEQAPGWVMLVLASMFVAGLGLWLPSMNYDDNSAHLLLPFQLLHDGYYHLDVQTQTWGLAPWANNVLHGIAALLAGNEARAAVDLAWLLLGVSGAFRLASALDAPPRAALAAAAVYASLPLTGFFTTSMQVDGASAAALMHFAAILVLAGRRLPAAGVTGLLLGLLAGLKATNAVYALPALAWLCVRHKQPGWLLRMGATAAVVGGASYAYSYAVTGNPLFPLFNSVFQSAYYPAVDFVDPRWAAGISWTTVWELTMHSDRYGEFYPGAWGISPMALVPALLLGALVDARLRWVALWFLLSGVIVFAQVQYLRYIFQATAVLGVLGVVALHRLVVPRAFMPIVVLLVAGNACLLTTTSWMVHQDPWRILLAKGRTGVQAIEAEMTPERVLLRRIMEKDDGACILLATQDSPYIGIGGGRAFSVKGSYDLRLAKAFKAARDDQTGAHWRSLLNSLGVSYVITTVELDPNLKRVLGEHAFVRIDQQGQVATWAHPDPSDRVCTGTLEHDRDEAHRLLHPGDLH